MFEHNFLPRLVIPTKMVGSDRTYESPEGDFLSVTTILKKAMGTKALDNWRERVGDEKAEQISIQARNRGNAIHKLAESYLLNQKLASAMPTNIHLFDSVKEILDKNIGIIYGIEMPLFSTFLRCGGCADVVAKWGKYRSIIDFKTSLRIKKEKYIESYLLQATAYSIMVEERYGLVCPQIVIVILVDHEEPQIFVRRRLDYQDQVVKIFQSQ